MLIFFLDGFFKLKNIILSSKNNIVIHSYEVVILALLLLPFRLLLNIPIVVTIHGEGWYGYYKLQRSRDSFFL